MSLSVNNPAFVSVDTSTMTPSLPTVLKADGHLATPTTPSSVKPAIVSLENNKSQHNELINGAAITKLFDMFEQFFRSMREMFLGNNRAPDTLPAVNNLPVIKPDAVKPPLVSIKPDVHKPLVPVVPTVPNPPATVINDGNTDVHVNINLGQCYCPDDKRFWRMNSRPVSKS